MGSSVARLRQDATFFLGAYDARACTAFHLAAFTQVLDYTERGLSIYDPHQRRALASLYGKALGSLASIGLPWPSAFWAIRIKRCNR
jgi:hypothetical protein